MPGGGSYPSGNTLPAGWRWAAPPRRRTRRSRHRPKWRSSGCPLVRTTGRSSGRARGVLGRTGLTADIEPFEPGQHRRAADVDAPPHALDDRLEMLGVDLRIMALVETAVERIPPLDLLDDMRDVVITAVGDDGREVGQLQRRAAQRILPDGERNDRQRIPRPAVLAVVPARSGTYPSRSSRKSEPSLRPKPKLSTYSFQASYPSLTFPYLGLSRISRNT